MARLFFAPLGLGLLVAFGGCHHDPKPMHVKAGDLPPLPPASGTPIGYLLDDSTDLKLNEDQITKLKDLDASLAAQNSEIDTQLRQIEKPDDEEEQAMAKAHQPHKLHNNAPGAQVRTTADAGKLHEIRNSNERTALKQAFALLDQPQQDGARRLLEDHGFEAPGSAKKPPPSTEDGTPLPDGEP